MFADSPFFQDLSDPPSFGNDNDDDDAPEIDIDDMLGYPNHTNFEMDDQEDEDIPQQIGFKPIPEYQVTPTTEDYNWLLHSIQQLCIDANKPEQFSKMVDQMNQRGLIPKESVHNSFCPVPKKKKSKNGQPVRVASPFSQFYNTLENVGEGGYGKVMKIQNLIDKQYYALKVIKLDKNEVKMAFSEVQCLAHLQSPRVVRYYNAWIEENDQTSTYLFYIQMEFVEGQSLAEFLNDNAGNISIEIIHQILIELVLALNDLHSAGVVHRDFRPSNVMLRQNGSICVIDFGISSVRRVLKPRSQMPSRFPSAVQIPKRIGSLTIRPFEEKIIQEAGQSTSTIKRVGTPIYSSPQQLNGRSSTNGDDIYSMGIIMFEMLSQFQTQMEKVKMIQKLRNSNELPETFIRTYPDESQMILKMIDNERDKRPSAADILHSDLFQRWVEEDK